MVYLHIFCSRNWMLPFFFSNQVAYNLCVSYNTIRLEGICCGNAMATSFCLYQQYHRHVSNETPNDVLGKCWQCALVLPPQNLWRDALITSEVYLKTTPHWQSLKLASDETPTNVLEVRRKDFAAKSLYDTAPKRLSNASRVRNLQIPF